ncbi:hypothetical protein LINGRAHAP2_LOCUS10019 [Linum grandiflorum]
MGFTAATGKLDAPEDVWDRLKLVHGKMYYRFRKQGCLEYRDLCCIFGDTTATGEYARPSAISFSDDNPEKQDEDIDANVVDMTNLENTDELAKKVKKRDQVNDKSKSDNRNAKKVKIDSSNGIEKSLAVMAENSKRRADMLEQKLAASSALAAAKTEALLKKNDTSNLVKCVKIMENLEIDGMEYTKGIDRLVANPVLQELFLTMNDQRKIEWLKSSSNL